jgi:hypothetical protein
MFRQPESQISKWSFHLPLFPMESFWYLIYRIAVHGIGISTERKQCMVKYFNTSARARVGLGLAKKRPTKAAPEGYCSIGGILTSVE